MSASTLSQALEGAKALSLDRLDAQLLLLHALGRPDTDRAWLLTHDSDPFDADLAGVFDALAQRRQAGEPLAYIVGRKEFFGLDLQVDERVLVPRPDTETLVNWALEMLAATDAEGAARVLDLGTGSGAIALAVSHALKQQGTPAHIEAVDASPGALAVAQANGTRLQLDVQFSHSDWFKQVSGHFQLILSNPPYIADGDDHLAALIHEPLQALTAGKDGLDDIRRIVQDAPDHLVPGGWLLLEHGYDQAAAVAALLAERGFACPGHRQDLGGVTRCTGGQWPESVE